MGFRPNWHYDHPPACTCAKCSREGARRPERREGSRSYGWADRPTVTSRRGRLSGWVTLSVIAALVIILIWALAAYQENVPVAERQQEPSAPDVARVTKDTGATPERQQEFSEPDEATARYKHVGEGPLNHGEIEMWVIEFTNEERRARGLRPLRRDSAISDIARSHSENMVRLGFLSHDIGGRDPTDRALAAGYDCRAYHGDGSYSYGLSENIAEHPRVTQWVGRGSSYRPVIYDRNSQAMARGLVQGWMGSPATGRIYWT